MATPQTITGLTLLKLGNLSYATLIVTDPNGNLAMGTTPFYQNPSGILVPGQSTFASAFNASNVALTSSGSIPGATYTAAIAGRLLLKILLANPAIANPGAALTLSQASGSSALTATTYYVAQTQTNANGSTTVGASQASIAVSTAGNVITTSVTLEPGATGVGIYVGTASGPLLLGTISSTGVIAYSGGATSGLAVTVSGSTLSITISAAATSTGSAEPTSNTTAAAQVLSQTVTPAAGTGATGSINSGIALTPGSWYTFDEPVNAGEQVSLNLGGAALVTAIATMEEA